MSIITKVLAIFTLNLAFMLVTKMELLPAMAVAAALTYGVCHFSVKKEAHKK